MNFRNRSVQPIRSSVATLCSFSVTKFRSNWERLRASSKYPTFKMDAMFQFSGFGKAFYNQTREQKESDTI